MTVRVRLISRNALALLAERLSSGLRLDISITFLRGLPLDGSDRSENSFCLYSCSGFVRLFSLGFDTPLPFTDWIGRKIPLPRPPSDGAWIQSVKKGGCLCGR